MISFETIDNRPGICYLSCNKKPTDFQWFICIVGKPVLVLRDTTERPEAVDAGTVKLVGTAYDDVLRETSLLLDDSKYYQSMAEAANPYGDGRACERIIRKILHENGYDIKILSEFSPN